MSLGRVVSRTLTVKLGRDFGVTLSPSVGRGTTLCRRRGEDWALGELVSSASPTDSCKLVGLLRQ